MNTGTFHQAIHALTLIHQQGLGSDELNTLYDGYLTDLALGVRKGVLPPRAEFRQFIGLPPAELITEIDFSMTLHSMIAAGQYDWMNDHITADRFLVAGSGKKRCRNKLFHFAYDISSDNAVAAMEKEEFKPGDHVHGLAFGATFPDEQRKHSIACLGSFGRVGGDRRVLCLGKGVVGRTLFLRRWGDGWDRFWCLLGVQDVSDV